jgi:hypothetical protein
MYNRKVLIDALKSLGNAKAPSTKKDIIVDPNGQWAHPGEITRIPSNTITMSGVPYPVLGKPNVGEPQMMYPGENYQFPDADYVDEFPMQQGNQLAKKSLGGLTRFTGSAGKMMSLPPIAATAANTAPKIVANLPKLDQATMNLAKNISPDSFLPISFGQENYVPQGQDWYHIDPEDYRIFNEETQQWEINPEWKREGLTNAYDSLNETLSKLPEFGSSMTKGLGDYNFKDFSDGWEARNAMMQSYSGPQWAPTKDDFYTLDEFSDLVNKQNKYLNDRADFEDMYPESPGMEIMRALSGDTSRDELFSNLFPNSSIQNFKQKFYTPELLNLMKNTDRDEKGRNLYEMLSTNTNINDNQKLNKGSLNSLTKGEDTLPRTYQELRKFSEEGDWLKTADPKMIANEFRGMLKLKTDDINNATPQQLELWRRQVISQMRTQALDKWNAETANPLTGNDAYGQFFNRPGSRNKEGGAIKYEEGGETPKEFVSAQEGVETPIYKKVSVKKSNIAGKGLFTNEPVKMGEPVGISHIRKVIKKDGELYQAPFPSTVLGYYNHSEEPNVKEVDNGDHIVMVALRDIKPNEELTSNYDVSGISDLETTANFKKGGSTPRLPKKNNPRSYSRSLEATNRLLAEHPFFAKSKSKKNKIYDPNSKYQDGGEPGDKFKKRLMKRNPGMQGVYGPEGENLNIVKDPNYDAASKPYYAGDIEFMFPGLPQVSYANKDDETLPDYVYANPSPDKYTSVYNPRGANRADIFLDMLHGMRDDQNYEVLLQNFDKAVRDARGGDMQYYYEQDVANNKYTDGQEQWDDNYVDGQLRAQLAPGTLGMFSHGRRDYRKERRHDSPEMRQAGKDIKSYLKTPKEEYIEAELTPEEIQEYAKGGFIIEDISVPQLTKASYGMITKAAGKMAKAPKAPSGWVRGTTTILPRIEPTSVQLGNLPEDFDIKNVNLPLTINDSKNKGYMSLYPFPGKRGMDGNTFHFLANMDSPLESGRAFKLMNESFTKPNPVILEPFSLSVDSLNTLLNMGRRPDWSLSYEDDLPLNYLTKHSNLFEGLKLPKGFRTMASLSDETANEMLTRLNNLLQEKGMTEQARIVNVPGGPMKEIRVPNYKLTRNYSQGGFLPKANMGLIVPKVGQLARTGIYKGVNPASYNILSKVKAVPNELFNTAVNNSTRPFRVGMSLKYGHQSQMDDLLKSTDLSLKEFKRMSDADKMQLFDQRSLNSIEDVGKRRLDAWAVGLGLPQEYSTLQQIGDNKFRMLDTEYSPMYFNELYNDLRALGYENTMTAGHNPLEDLSREFYKTQLQNQYTDPLDLNERMRQEDLMRIFGYSPWKRTRNARLNPKSFSGIDTGSVYDNDAYGVMGGFRWDIDNTDKGLQFKTSDVWDLNPFEKRGSAYLEPSNMTKKALESSYFKPLENLEALKLVGGKPFLIENTFDVDPKTYKTLDSYEEGGDIDYELGDEVDEATMRELEKLGYTFEKI